MIFLDLIMYYSIIFRVTSKYFTQNFQINYTVNSEGVPPDARGKEYKRVTYLKGSFYIHIYVFFYLKKI